MGEMITFPSNGDDCPGYLARPVGSGPGVVVIQEWWGLVGHIKDVCDRFADAGFVALAPDLYRGATTTEPDEAGKMMMAMELPDAARDMARAFDHLLTLDVVAPKKVGSVGFCMGGALSLVLATVRPISAAVTFYGLPFKGDPDYGAIEGAVLGQFAENDDWANRDAVEATFSKLSDLGIEAEYTIHPGTEHAFFNDNRPEVYDADASAVAWDSTIAFFRRHLA